MDVFKCLYCRKIFISLQNAKLMNEKLDKIVEELKPDELFSSFMNKYIDRFKGFLSNKDITYHTKYKDLWITYMDQRLTNVESKQQGLFRIVKGISIKLSDKEIFVPVSEIIWPQILETYGYIDKVYKGANHAGYKSGKDTLYFLAPIKQGKNIVPVHHLLIVK